jgi:hypothetical protein
VGAAAIVESAPAAVSHTSMRPDPYRLGDAVWQIGGRRNRLDGVLALLVRNIRLELEDPEAQLLEAVAKRLRVPQSAVRAYAAVRRSLDARKHDDLHFIYHLEVALDEDKWSEARCIKRIGAPNVVPIKSSRTTRRRELNRWWKGRSSWASVRRECSLPCV